MQLPRIVCNQRRIRIVLRIGRDINGSADNLQFCYRGRRYQTIPEMVRCDDVSGMVRLIAGDVEDGLPIYGA